MKEYRKYSLADEKSMMNCADKIIRHLRSFLLVCILLSLFFGCATADLNFATSTVLQMPRPFPDIVYTYKSVKIRANKPALKRTGVFVEAGQTLSVLASGKVKVYQPRRGYSDPWHGPYSKLSMRIGSKIITATGYETFEAPISGELRFGVRDYGEFNSKTGIADQPRNYADNLGSFQVDIIVWRTDNYAEIARFFKKQVEGGNDKIEIKMALNNLSQYEEIDLARNEATREMDATRQQLDQLIEVSRKQPDSLPQVADQTVKLENRLDQLKTTIDKLNQMEQQLAAERKKTAELSQQLALKEERERDLMKQIQDSGSRPAAVLVSEPGTDNKPKERPFHWPVSSRTTKVLST
jgi:hypothetical protein